MAQLKKPRHRRARSFVDQLRKIERVLELDRALVEISMQVYNLPPGERFSMRELNQRLHDMLKQSWQPGRKSRPRATIA